MDAKLKAKALTDDELDGVAGGRVIMGREVCLDLGSRQEVDNMTCRDIDDLFNSKYHKGTMNKQPTLNTYSYKFP